VLIDDARSGRRANLAILRETEGAMTDAAAFAFALAIALCLGFVARWVYGPTRAQRRRRDQLAQSRDFGLLVPLVTLPARSAAERGRAQLAAHGIRATVAQVPDGPLRVTHDGDLIRPAAGHQILVVPDDVEQATRLLDASGGR
jgi:hypothetical protein